MTGLGVPVYDVVESGPDHAKTFQATVNIDDQSYGPGAGRNKKEAEQNAAAIAFAALKGSRGSGPISPTRSHVGPRSVPELPEVEVVRRGLAEQHHRAPDRSAYAYSIRGRSVAT